MSGTSTVRTTRGSRGLLLSGSSVLPRSVLERGQLGSEKRRDSYVTTISTLLAISDFLPHVPSRVPPSTPGAGQLNGAIWQSGHSHYQREHEGSEEDTLCLVRGEGVGILSCLHREPEVCWVF